MNHKIESDICLRCRRKNTLLRGVCCICGHNHQTAKPATANELADREAELGDAVAKMESILAKWDKEA